MANKARPSEGMKPNNTLLLRQFADETGAQAMARRVLEPDFRHAQTASMFASPVLGKLPEAPGLMDYITHLENLTAKAEKGDLALASRILAAQAVTLDSMFSELARRLALNMGEYIGAAERYGRLALKAQSNCRATLDALAKLHQPREQTVRHIHVNEGGQALIADQFHNHAGGSENAKTCKQSHATGTAGPSAKVLGQESFGNGVPISCSDRESTLQDARRNESGSA